MEFRKREERLGKFIFHQYKPSAVDGVLNSNSTKAIFSCRCYLLILMFSDAMEKHTQIFKTISHFITFEGKLRRDIEKSERNFWKLVS